MALRKLWLGVWVSVFAIAAGGYLLATHESGRVAEPKRDPAPAGVPDQRRDQLSSIEDGLSASNRLPEGKDFAADFRRAGNLRPFVESARRRAGEGGTAYARAGLLECHALMDLAQRYGGKPVSAGGANAAQRSVLNVIRERCGDFTPDELNVAAFPKVSASSSDPLLRIQGDLLRRGLSADERRRLADQVLNLKDPLLLSLGNALALSQKGQFEYFLDGKPIPEEEVHLFASAWRMVACDYGANCGVSNPEVAAACLTDGLCAEGLNQLLENLVEPAHRSRLGEYRARITAIVRERNSSALLPPS